MFAAHWYASATYSIMWCPSVCPSDTFVDPSPKRTGEVDKYRDSRQQMAIDRECEQLRPSIVQFTTQTATHQ